METKKFYLVEKSGHIASVFLNRPEKKNAMNREAWTEAPPIFGELDNDPRIRAIIVAGMGTCFSAGIDLEAMIPEMPELTEPYQSGATKWRLVQKIARLQETMTCIERCRKPVIAAIHGPCIGAGLDMAAACDIRLASAEARFSLREAAVGFVADVGVLQRLPHIVGQGITREMAFTAKTIDAKQAAAIHLVNRVYQDREALMAGAEEMALEIAGNSPLAVQGTKDVLNFGIGKSVTDGLRYVASLNANLIPSADLTEALTAFAERRKPNFTGE
jgi:enoyl-CoA hydratase